MSVIWGWATHWIWGWGGLAGVAMIVAWVLFFVTPAFLLPLKETILHVAIGLTVFFFLATALYTKGYRDALAVVAKSDAAAISRKTMGDKARDACKEIDGVWDTATGTCQ